MTRTPNDTGRRRAEAVERLVDAKAKFRAVEAARLVSRCQAQRKAWDIAGEEAAMDINGAMHALAEAMRPEPREGCP